MKKLFYLVSLLSLTSFSQVQVTVDTANKKQTINGLGTCGGSSAQFNDLGCSVTRMSLLGVVGLEDTLSGTSNPNILQLSNFTWPQGMIEAAQIAHQANIKVIVNVFSPPAWMKTNNNVNNGGALMDNMYGAFGIWSLGCIESFKLQAGFDMYAFSPQNEPEFPEAYASCLYNPSQLMQATTQIGKNFTAQGIPTKIFYPEALFTQGNVLNFCQAANNDDSCKNYVAAFAIHISDVDGLNVGGSTAYQYKSVYAESQRVAPIKEFWLTEDSNTDGYSQDGTSIPDATMLEACHFYNGMEYGNLSMWLFCANNTPAEWEIYYLYKQLFRYIRPNSVRMESSSSSSNILPLTFRNDSLQNYTIVLINKGNNDTTANIVLPGITENFDVFLTSTTQMCQYIGKSNLYNLKLPANSITSLVYVAGVNIPTINDKYQVGFIDTIAVLEGTTDTINFSGIGQGSGGNKHVSFTLTDMNPSMFNNLTFNYSSPNSTADLAYSLTSGYLGTSILTLTENDSSKTFEGMYSQNQQIFYFITIPVINKPPFFDSIADQTYKSSQFNIQQDLNLTNANDGNNGTQILTLTVISSNPKIVSATPSGNKALELLPKENGTATITVTLTDNGNTDLEYKSGIRGVNTFTRKFKAISGSGINDLKEEQEEKIQIYPNPASEFITISNPAMIYKALSIIDLTGKVLFSQLLTNEITTINVKSFDKGTYLFKFISDNCVTMKRIIIE